MALRAERPGLFQWKWRNIPSMRREKGMGKSATRGTKRTHRTLRPSLNPYCIEDIGLTLGDVLRARAGDADTLADS
jgi:hypothetical protein